MDSTSKRLTSPRSIKRDLTALALLAVCAFLALSLVSYNPAESLDGLVYPAPEHATNSCGKAGAIVADLAFQAFGVGAWYALISLAVVDGWLLLRRPIPDPYLRSFGWLLSFVALSVLVSLTNWGWSPGPVIGPGGYLGAAGRGLLEMHFANAGAYLLTISALVGGLLLCTEYWLPRVVLGVVSLPHRALKDRLARAADGKLETKPRVRTDIDDVDEADAPAIRIRGKAIADPSAEDDEADETSAALDDEPIDEESDEAEPSSPAAMKAKGASEPRLKRPRKSEREEVMEELDAASRAEEPQQYELPSIDLLLEGEEISYEAHEQEVRRQAKILEKTFLNFGFKVKVVEIETGPVIAQFEVELEAGLRLSKITSLADDLAIALRVPSVRIVAPIPGKNTVGIEVPNSERHLVRIREVIEESAGTAQKMRIPIYLGKDVSGKPMVVDLSTLPHLLIAGRTGTGKSVCLNSIIVSMLMSRRPDEVRMLMIDPKMVELSCYKSLPHLMHPVVTDMRKAEAILAWAVEKMEERYALLARAGVRHIGVYNQLGEEELMDRLQPEDEESRRNIPTTLPYIVIVADEMADLMMTSAKEVEQHIIRLAQKSRAVGIHLVLATQKPTVDVITGLIKSNLPARIAFQVASRTDSRVVLDEMGADKLLGNGDMLFLWPGTSTLLRGQGTYVSDDEINAIMEVVGTTEQQFVKELVQLKAPEPKNGEDNKLPNRDELYEAAVDVVVREGRGSVSLLQRALGVGYGRAARLIDYMAEDGIVGNYNGSQAREVLVTLEQWATMSAQGGGASPAPAGPKSGRVLTVGSRSGPRSDDDDDHPRGEIDHRHEEDDEVDSELEDDEDDELGDDYEEEDEEEPPFDEGRTPAPKSSDRRYRRGRESA
ncbi:MAG TPA: DNA translocase FtsK [Pirellulales bacterium]|nr:DNA translocase FtsK [Pirellulales bacterium]